MDASYDDTEAQAQQQARICGVLSAQHESPSVPFDSGMRFLPTPAPYGKKEHASSTRTTNMTYGKSAGWVFFIAMIALVNGQRDGSVEPSSGPAAGVMAEAQRVAPSETIERQPALVDSRGANRQGTARAQATKVSLPRT